LPTELVDEDKSYYYYHAETPSFSWFAIGIAEGATILPAPTAEETQISQQSDAITTLPASEQVPSATSISPVGTETIPSPEENNLSTSMIVVLVLVPGLAGIVGSTLIRRKQKAKYPDWWYDEKK